MIFRSHSAKVIMRFCSSYKRLDFAFHSIEGRQTCQSLSYCSDGLSHERNDLQKKGKIRESNWKYVQNLAFISSYQFFVFVFLVSNICCGYFRVHGGCRIGSIISVSAPAAIFLVPRNHFVT